MDTYNNMEAKRITINQAKKVLENINTYVHVCKFETGLRTNLKRVKSKCYTTTYEYMQQNWLLLLKLTYIEFLRWKDPKHVIT